MEKQKEKGENFRICPNSPDFEKMTSSERSNFAGKSFFNPNLSKKSKKRIKSLCETLFVEKTFYFCLKKALSDEEN